MISLSRARKVALLVADGVDGGPLRELADRLVAEGAVPRFLGSTLGAVLTATGEAIEVDATLENTPSVLYDAVVLPDGSDGVKRLAADGRSLEFLKDQYRHCKPILALGAGRELLDRAAIPTALPSGDPDPGLILGTRGAVSAFLKALAVHRHFDRETDPPRV